MTRRRSPPPRRFGKPPSGVGAPPLSALDEFSAQSVANWLRAADRLRAVQSALHFGLEQQRQHFVESLTSALREAAAGPLDLENWSRIVDYRYCLAPLSVRGSLVGDGGRFNIGADLNPGSFTPFPALYVGEDYATAYTEKFGHPPDHRQGGLTPAELALRAPGSFTHVCLRGCVELVLDLEVPRSLATFTKIIKDFHVPLDALRHARSLGARAPGLIRSASQLRDQLLDPNWRRLPVEFDLPSNSQVFGRFAAAAGLHGLVYPSVRLSGKRCLALFPQNWEGSSSFIEVADRVPDGARLVRIDGLSRVLE